MEAYNNNPKKVERQLLRREGDKINFVDLRLKDDKL